MLTKVVSRGRFHDLFVLAHSRKCPASCTTPEWVLALVMLDGLDAAIQAQRWEAKLQKNPFARVSWSMALNRIEADPLEHYPDVSARVFVEDWRLSDSPEAAAERARFEKEQGQ